MMQIPGTCFLPKEWNGGQYLMFGLLCIKSCAMARSKHVMNGSRGIAGITEIIKVLSLLGWM